tara:strand:+ start:182 stop:385 length:204 start_codon:yes stop_codon:yes gene_type:complete
MEINYRVATKDDSQTILNFIRELAEYEKLLDEVTATEADIQKTVFDGTGPSFCLTAEVDGLPVGFCQ